MPGPTLQLDALVLRPWAPTDSFKAFTIFSAEQGTLRIQQRLQKKPTSAHLAIDLFDEVSLFLEGTPTEDAWFVKEVTLLTRHTTIGRNFEALRQASALANLVARNPSAEEGYPAVYKLLRTAFNAFATSNRPDIVYFKSLYCFARDEGHPIKQHWFSTLSAADQSVAAALISQPLASQTAPTAEVTRLLHRLETYLREHTEIRLD